MAKWAKRIAIFILLMVWLLILLTPTLAVVLARSGQIQLGSTDGPHTRIFMLQEADNEGIAIERARRVRSPQGAEGTTTCLRTTVRYWMWTEGTENENVDYCQCIDNSTGDVVSAESPACALP